jgi:hypothetical protein
LVVAVFLGVVGRAQEVSDARLPPAAYEIRTRPAVTDAQVLLDGRTQATTNDSGIAWVNVAAGVHTIEVLHEDYQPGIASIQAPDPPLSATVDVEMVPAGGGLTLLGVLLALCAACTIALAVVTARRARAPTLFDRYEVIRQLGRGGMATVFLARDRSLRRRLRRPIALKVMDPALTHDEDLVRKFVKEGEALQRIAQSAPDAPVVRAIRFGRENGSAHGRPFVAMEYVEGSTLLRVLQTGVRLPIVHALAIARQVAHGLAAAHAHGIWHRDVSPDNVLVVGSDRHGPTVKLIDFGVAKHEYTQVHTLDGSITGKPAYMSPEQCRGEPLDGRSDLYAVGVMLYTLLSGRPPFTDSNPLLVMRMHETAEPPALPDSVPHPVRDLVMRLLSKKREDRPRSAAELAAELSALERMN